MDKEEILALLAAHRAELDRYGVQSLAVFGSVARGEAGPESDVDVLVEFTGPTGFFEFMDLKDYLEALLGRPVDLVTRKALKRQLRDQILAEAVYAA
jgi:hypothetical protein